MSNLKIDETFPTLLDMKSSLDRLTVFVLSSKGCKFNFKAYSSDDCYTCHINLLRYGTSILKIVYYRSTIFISLGERENILGLTWSPRLGLELTTIWMLSESATTRLPQHV
jgi:hypothetical protein